MEASAAFQRGVQNKDRLLQARKDFSQAADHYLSLHQAGHRSVALYRNLGNAAALADRWPEAIWAYHIGLALDPNDRELRDRLEFVRRKVVYPASGQGRLPPDNWPVWLHRPTQAQLFCACLIAYSGACFAGVIGWSARKPGIVLVAVALFLVLIAAGGGLWLDAGRAHADGATPRAVVIENTPLYRGNGVTYPQHAAMPLLPRGLEVRRIHERGNWIQVRLTTGEVGWAPIGRVRIVAP